MKARKITSLEDEVLNDFTIAIDTRETVPYRFQGDRVVFKKLDTGDYSIKGFEDVIVIERKTHGDFLGSIVGARRQLFKNEMARMQKLKVKCLVIEASYEQIQSGAFEYGHVHPETAVGTIVAIITRFSVPVLLAGKRVDAEKLVRRILVKAYLIERGIK